LTLEVRDDGSGGADATRGSGILGLADRVEALDAVISIASPPRGAQWGFSRARRTISACAPSS
jgi:signal transduction histidine kinase